MPRSPIMFGPAGPRVSAPAGLATREPPSKTTQDLPIENGSHYTMGSAMSEEGSGG
jgi:hypothetical protein